MSWEKNWANCYYNPDNNINPDIANHAGPGEFVTMKNPINKYPVKVNGTRKHIS